MTLPRPLTPKTALDVLCAYFPESEGYNHEVTSRVSRRNWKRGDDTQFIVEVWKPGEESIRSEGPILHSALSLILENREPVQVFTENPDAQQFFKSAEDDAEALRLSALSAGAKVEHERFFHNGDAVWRCLGEGCEIWHKLDPVFTESVCFPDNFREDQEITRAEALKLTGGAL